MGTAEPGPAVLWGNGGEAPRTAAFVVSAPVLVEISPSKAAHMLGRDELISSCHGTAGKDPSVGSSDAASLLISTSLQERSAGTEMQEIRTFFPSAWFCVRLHRAVPTLP